MRKKIAFILALAMLNCNMNALADTESESGAIVEETAAVSAEATDNTAPDNRISTESTETQEGLVEEAGETQEEEPVGESAATQEEEGTTTEPGSGEEPSAEAPQMPEEESANENTEIAADEQRQTLEYGTEQEDTIYNVLFPANTRAYLDPGNLSGKGQIFSEQYKVENYGNTDVAIKIKDVEILTESAEDAYKFLEGEITDASSTERNLNVVVVWENEDGTGRNVFNMAEEPSEGYVIRLEAANYDEDGEFVSLGEGCTGHFYFTGTMNPNPYINWEDCRMAVVFNYEIVNPDFVETDGEQESEGEQERYGKRYEENHTTADSGLESGENGAAADGDLEEEGNRAAADGGSQEGGSDTVADSSLESGENGAAADGGLQGGENSPTADSGSQGGGNGAAADSGSQGGGNDTAVDGGSEGGGNNTAADGGSEGGGNDTAADSGSQGGGSDAAADSGSEDRGNETGA